MEYSAQFCVMGGGLAGLCAALSSCRVMATCALLGQAVGTTVAVIKEDNSTPRTINTDKQQRYLMLDDCFITKKKREVSVLSKKDRCSAPIIMNGVDRGRENMWISEGGECIEYTFDKPEFVNKVRLVFDSDLNRSY